MAFNKDDSDEAPRTSRRYSWGEYGVWRYLERVAFAVLMLFGSLAVAAALVATSMGLNFLMAWAFGEDSHTYQLYRLISSVFLIGASLVMAAAGSIVAILETGASLFGYIQMLRGQDEADD